MPSLVQKVAVSWPFDAWCDRRTLFAVSGGPDSVALFRSILALGGEPNRIAIAHFNHRLRGDESDGDEAFVRALATDYDVAVFVERAESTERSSSEDRLRTLRYDFLKNASHEFGARYLLTGHTADDQAETILFRILRGTGLAGLAGIPESRRLSEAVTLVRPLLNVRRAEVLEYLALIGQRFRIDSSNSENRYTRNRLRNEVVPLLQEVGSGDIVTSLIELGQQASELLAPLQNEARALLEIAVELSPGRAVVNLPLIPERTSVAVLREMFVELWREQNWPRGQMGREHWSALANLAKAKIATNSTNEFPGKLRVSTNEHGLLIELVEASVHF